MLWIGRLGDIVVTSPFFAALRAKLPSARIRLVSGEGGAGVARLCPGLDEVAVLRRWHHPLANLRLAAGLMAADDDLLIDLNSSYSRSSCALALLSRAPMKLAFSRGRGDGIFTHLIAAPAETEHMLDRYGRLAAALGAPYEPRPRVQVHAWDMEAADRLLRALALPGGKLLVGVHPGNFKKFDNRWPEEKFVELGGRLQARKDVSLVFLAGPGEEVPVRAIASKLKRPAPVLVSPSVAVAAGLLSRLSLFVGNATGTAHLAAAVGTPTFCLLARYTKTVWMPRAGAGRNHEIVSDSWRSCRDIPVETAWKALEDALADLSRGDGTAPAV